MPSSGSSVGGGTELCIDIISLSGRFSIAGEHAGIVPVKIDVSERYGYCSRWREII